MFGKKSERIRELEREVTYQRNRANSYHGFAEHAQKRALRLQGDRDTALQANQSLTEQLRRANARHDSLKGKYDKLKAGLEKLGRI